MKNLFRTFILLCVFPLFVFAQQPLEQGSKYINFEIDRTPLISGGYFIISGIALDAGIGLAFNGDVDANGLALRLGVDQYWGEGSLIPFYGGFLRFDVNPNALGSAGWKGSRFVLGGQWGISYFLLKQLAIAGSIGAELQLNSPENSGDSTNFTSFTSGLKVRFYF